MALHQNLAIGNIHVPYQWEYANAAARTGASGFVSGDVGKLARQLDDNSLWLLTATTPTWVTVGGGGGSSFSTLAELNALVTDATLDDDGDSRTPSGSASGQLGGSYPSPDVRGVRETGGPTELSIGSISDGQNVVRSGTQLIGQSGSAPGLHASTHEDGGADEVDVGGLSGLLADGQTPLTHATSHQNGGADEISVAGLSGLLGDDQTPLTHASSHQNGGADEISVAGLNGVLADAQNADEIQGRDVQNAAPDNGQVLVWSTTNSRWQPEDQGASASVFGLNYQTVVSAARSTTTSTTFQTKTTLTTPALTGTFRVGWHAIVDQSNVSDSVEAQLYNDTDSTVLGVAHSHEPKDVTNRIGVGGFAEVVFTGAAKSFEIQYRQQRGSTAGIQDARIEFWRVS